MRVFGATFESHLWRAASLLLIFALGCADEQREPEHRLTNEKIKSGPTLDADKPPQLGEDAESFTGKVITVIYGP